jgi:hypothetical protein
MADDAEQWGPWTDHDGKGCPCPGKWVRVVGKCYPVILEGIAVDGGGWHWTTPDPAGATKVGAGFIYDPIIRYQIRKPRALLQLMEIAANPPAIAPAREMEKETT